MPRDTTEEEAEPTEKSNPLARLLAGSVLPDHAIEGINVAKFGADYLAALVPDGDAAHAEQLGKLCIERHFRPARRLQAQQRHPAVDDSVHRLAFKAPS